ITSPSAGFPKTFRTSLVNTQSCPCKIRARGLTTIPAIETQKTSNAQRPTSNIECRNLLDVRRSALDVRRSEMQAPTQSSIDLPGIKKMRSGKVREVFDLGQTLLFVATDRISAFDVILPDPIPHKGAVLNQLSAFWFKRFGNSEMSREQRIYNHFVTANFD